MKSKIKRHSRSVLAVILTLSMLVSCMMVGLIATDAARVTDRGTVGATDDSTVGAITDIQIRGSFNNWSGTANHSDNGNFPFSTRIHLTADSYTFKVVFVENGDNYCGLDSGNSYTVGSGLAQLGWKTGADISLSISEEGDYSFTVSTSNSKNYISVEKVVNHTVNFGVNGSNGTLTASASIKGNLQNADTVGSDETVTFTASPDPGYVAKWYSDSGCTTPISNTGNTYTATASANLNVYVKFEQVPTTTIYIAKNDYLSKIYAWYNDGTADRAITANFPGDAIDQTVPYNLGGVVYYKYTFALDISTFSFKLNDGSNSRESAAASNYTAGGTYYVQWNGGNTKEIHNMTTGGTYPNYILSYKKTSDSNWIREQFVSGAVAIDLDGDSAYQFFIVRQEWENNAYSDNQWYNSADKTISSSNSHNVYCTHSGTSNIPLTTTDGGEYTFSFGSLSGNKGVTMNIDYPAVSYYLTGWLNGASVTTKDNSRKFTATGTANEYSLTYTFTGNQGGSQYVTIFDGTTAYHPATHNSGTGTAGTTTNNAPGNDPKWKVDATTDQSVTFTWNSDTKVLSWSIAPLTTTYRVVGSATFFGVGWDTSTASSLYNYMMTDASGPFTYNDTSYAYKSGPHTASTSYGHIDFKVWGSDNKWAPSGDNVTVPSLKKDQEITFYYDSTNGVAYEITGTGTDDPWPPSEISSKTLGDVQYDSLIYNISGGSNNITTNKTTLSTLQQETDDPKGWWADFSDLLPTIGTNQLYFNITNNGTYTGFYASSEMTFNTDNAPGITVKKTDKDSTYNYIEVSGVDSNLTNLGVYITKGSNGNDGKPKFTYKFYTIKGAVSTVKTVKVYAKDGAIRRLGTSRDPRSNITYSTFEQHANTFICADSNYNTQRADAVRSSTHGANGTKETLAGSKEGTSSFSEYTYDYIAKFNKGDTLYITTVLDNVFKTNNYFVRGFSINGTVYELFDKNNNGVYSTSFVVPEDWSKSYVEITPIFQKEENANNILKFYVEGFDETVQDAGWGDTLGVYPFYQNPDTNSYIANINNPFGGYPGQPMIFYKGNYYIEVPKSYDSVDEKGVSCTATIKGITLSNLYWDDVHLYTGEVSSHFQTYDFDDLYKIYTEYGSASDFDKIVCAFKYRTKKNNDEPGSFSNAGNYTNGWEVLTDYKGQPVDVFGNVLPAASIPTEFTTYLNASTAEDKAAAADALKNVTGVVHVISQDYKSNSAGQYGTEWAIYNTSNAKVVENNGKTTIVPSALAIPTASGFDKYDAQTKAFKGIYQALYADSNVKNQPVLITYEKSIYGGGDKADRCDARWFFSKKDTITSSTRIEYSDDLGATWTTDTYNTGTGTGSTTGVKAYFTGKSTTAKDVPDSGTTETDDTTTSLNGVIGSGYYTLKAEEAVNYEFVGWYVLRDNYQLNAKSALSHAEIAKNGDVFVARFVKVATGTFTINHRVHPQSQGFGDVYVEAVVKNAGTQLGNKYGSVDPNSNPTSSITISGTSDTVNPGNQYIISGHGYVIEAKFVPDPYGTSSFANFYATVSDLLKDFNEYDYIKSIEINMEGEENYDNTKGTYALVTYDVDKLFDTNTTQKYTSVTHYSKFNLKTDVNYKLKYTFDTRYYGTKVYEYDQYFTEQELRSYFYSQITTKATTEIALDNQFVFSKAPFESNYREDLTWDITRVQIANNIGTLTATQVEKKTVKATVYDQGNDGSLATKAMTTRYMQVFDADNDADVSNPEFENFPAADCNLYQPNRTTYTDTEDNNTVKPVYIHHWNIYSEENFDFEYNTDNSIKFEVDGINFKVASKSQLVAQSYSSEFNYAGFEDYVVVPVYSKVKVNQQAESDALAQTGKATLLTITRNHWNNTTDGQATNVGYYDQPNTNYDRLYVDFMLNYNYKVNDKNVLLSTVNDSKIIVGFVVKSYTYDGTNRVYRTNQHGVELFQTVVVDKSKVDNKNRLEYCYGFNNTQNNSQWGLNFEFTPFIIDTSSTSADGDITYNGNKYSSLLVNPVPLRDVNFYMIGKENTDWN